MSAAIQRRLKALEHNALGGNRPSVAFVLWERSRDTLHRAYERALAAGAVKHGDPLIMGVMPEPAVLPHTRWTDVSGLTDVELDCAIATLEEEEGLPAQVEALRNGHPDVRQLTDDELYCAIADRAARSAR